MPTTPGCQPSPAAQTSGPSVPRARPAPAPRRARGLDRAPFGVQPVEPAASAAASAASSVGQQPRAQIRRADPAAGIHPRPEHEAQMVGVRRAVEPRDIGQRHQPGPVAPRHHLQPLPHEGAVDPDQRRHIGHRGQRHEVEHRHQVRPLDFRAAQLPVGLDQQQEDHARGAEMAQIAGFVLPVRVHHASAGGSVSPPRW
jgi:hypothetical protein